MNSQAIEGFKIWHPFNSELLSNIPDQTGVYVFRLNRKFGRLKGASDILYIGKSSSGLRSRLQFYFKPGKTQYTSQRINLFLKGHGGVQVSFVVRANPRLLEMDLIQKYFKEHEELPPLNRAG